MAYIIAFEGIDGTGKGTQARLLYERLIALGKRCLELSFPDYDSFLGREIGELLSGKHENTAATLDPKSMALWFAAERFRTFRGIDRRDYDFIVLNRYVLSNVAYQSLRVEPGERASFSQWVLELEHDQFGLPRPDVCFVFDVDESLSSANVSQKGYRGYTGDAPDVYESSSTTQTGARQAYRELARQLDGSILVECMDAGGIMRPAHEIAEFVFDKLIASFHLSP
ncbi:MAG: hypothetical protein FWE20_06075 [Defluviitaleaceae bacterium]|nr:hypothetical protein [Defluviitaleaceae bacterium]